MVNLLYTNKKSSLIYNALLLSIIFLFLLSFTSAAPPVSTIQQFTESYVIEDSPQTHLKQYDDYRYNFFLYNLSNGLTITNATTTCVFYLANSSGNVIILSNVSYYPADKYWSLLIDGGNFSNVGVYYYGTKCQGYLGGAITGSWYVTQNGQEPTISSALFEPAILLIISIMFLIAAVTFTNKRWVVKSALYLLSVLFMLMAINSSSGYIMNFRGTSMLNSAFLIAVASISLLFIILIVYYLKSISNAIKQSKSEKKEDLL